MALCRGNYGVFFFYMLHFCLRTCIVLSVQSKQHSTTTPDNNTPSMASSAQAATRLVNHVVVSRIVGDSDLSSPGAERLALDRIRADAVYLNLCKGYPGYRGYDLKKLRQYRRRRATLRTRRCRPSGRALIASQRTHRHGNDDLTTDDAPPSYDSLFPSWPRYPPEPSQPPPPEPSQPPPPEPSQPPPPGPASVYPMYPVGTIVVTAIAV